MKTSLIIVVALLSSLVLVGCNKSPSGDVASLGKCLTDKGAIFYGTTRCSHCNNQKSMLGSGMTNVTFVDCDQNKDQCAQAGIQGYPTRIFKDGSKLEGAQPLETLASKAGCVYTPGTGA
ncbi:MAG TPA: thioredoxin domain-containing protein [Candidatus Absconditabacterales bacterium]|nr:thioredoxin domain-containing protein [Candidatus Absconditabacterales bacterium]HNG97189.1 thioredoxin domain-containing protein [Candidatus Absconditabacterales bacterium]